MKKIIVVSALLCSFLFVPVFALAQTDQTQTSLTQQLVQALTKMIAQLEQEIQQILGQNNGKSPTVSITVTSPTAGQTFNDGDTIAINWAPANAGITEIDLVSTVHGRASFEVGGGKLVQPNTSGTASYKIDGSVVPAGSYYINLYPLGWSAGQPTIMSQTFNIITSYSPPVSTTQQSIKITSPVGGEQWQAGKTYNITWKAQNIGGIDDISLSSGYEILMGTNFAKNNSTHVNSNTVIKDIDPSTGSYSWTIPTNFTPSNYKIYISAHCKNNVNCGGEDSDSSRNDFSIIPQSTPVSITGWQTYANAQYGFSFQYPTSFGNVTTMGDGSITIGSTISIFLPGYFNENLTYDNIINSHSGAGYINTNIVVGGIQSIGSYSPQQGYTVYVPLANNQFLAILGPYNNQTFNQMLSSFKFTK